MIENIPILRSDTVADYTLWWIKRKFVFS